MARFSGKVAIVTGGAQGIGGATARRLAADGASVLIVDVNQDAATANAERIRKAGGKAAFRHLDVSDSREWRKAVNAAVRKFGKLDILVNNAGIGTYPDVESETVEGWNRLIAINQTGVWLGMKYAVPAMRTAGGGAIVNVSSIFGAVGGFGGSIAYHASKGAVRLMTKNAAIRYATENIRVNSMHPGFIDTPMIVEVKGTDTEALILANTPMGRLGRPEEIASAIAFLVSDDASYVTGSELYADGGWTAR